MAVKLVHERLAETHDFIVRLALRIEVRTAFRTADGEAGEGVFKNLLKTEELDRARGDARVEAEAAFVGADGGVELDAVAFVHAHLAGVVQPCDAEKYLPFGLHDAVDDVVFEVFFLALKQGAEGIQNFLRGLVKLVLGGTAYF